MREVFSGSVQPEHQIDQFSLLKRSRSLRFISGAKQPNLMTAMISPSFAGGDVFH